MAGLHQTSPKFLDKGNLIGQVPHQRGTVVFRC